MSKMHAQLLAKPAAITTHPLAWSEIDKPTPGPGQILIKVAACGVCRSNLHMIEGDWLPDVPAFSGIIPGHEVTGIVAEIGPDVTNLALGDHVGVSPLWSTDGTCEFCESEREMLCHAREITGETVNGGYAEYMLATAAQTFLLPDNLDLVDAAPLFCPGMTAYSAVNRLNIKDGSKIAIFGPGGVGHMAIQFAKLAGAEVTVVGRTQAHLDVALEVGADHIINSSDISKVEAIFDTMDGALIFADSDMVAEWAFKTIKWGGTLVNAVPLHLKEIHLNMGKRIEGTILSTNEEMRQVIKLAAEGKIRTVTERFPMAEADKALTLLSEGKLQSRAVLYNPDFA